MPRSVPWSSRWTRPGCREDMSGPTSFPRRRVAHRNPDRLADRTFRWRSMDGARSGILWAMLAIAVWIGGAAAQTSAPALGDRPAAPRTAAAKKHANAGKLAALSPPELAILAENYENHGGYVAALEALLELHKRVKPDADLEIEIALDEARTGHAE